MSDTIRKLAPIEPSSPVFPPPPLPGDPALDIAQWLDKVVDPQMRDVPSLNEAMAIAFTNQLGRPWKKLGDEPFVWQAVIAIVCGHAVGADQKKAIAHCRDFAGRAARDDASVGFPRRFIVPAALPGTGKPAARFLIDTSRGHHYSSTLVLDLLLQSRTRSGRLHSCEFTWVRKFDRQLWLILDAAGRPDLQPETAAVVSHCQDEKMLGRPLEKIHVDRLVQDAVLDFDRARRRD